MVKISYQYFVFIALFLEVYCRQRVASYSRVVAVATQYPLTLYYPKVSVLECGRLCIDDSYCTGFLINETSKHCNTVHCMNKASSTYQVLSPENDQLLHYRKDLNWIEYRGHHYFYVEEKTSWEVAKLECQKLCAYLVEIDSKEESDWLASSFTMKDECGANVYSSCTSWTGGNDREIEGRYVWDHSNTLINFTNWYPSEPIDTPVDHSFNCIKLLRNGEWDDYMCYFLDNYICEKNDF